MGNVSPRLRSVLNESLISRSDSTDTKRHLRVVFCFLEESFIISKQLNLKRLLILVFPIFLISACGSSEVVMTMDSLRLIQSTNSPQEVMNFANQNCRSDFYQQDRPGGRGPGPRAESPHQAHEPARAAKVCAFWRRQDFRSLRPQGVQPQRQARHRPRLFERGSSPSR